MPMTINVAAILLVAGIWWAFGWVAGASAYALVGLVTGIFHLAVIIGPVTNPVAVLRTMIFWPIMLWWLIAEGTA